jgi:hypothetical protein
MLFLTRQSAALSAATGWFGSIGPTTPSRVDAIERVAVLTGGLGCVFSRDAKTAPQVDAPGYWLQVRRVHTPTTPAQMVQVGALWNRAARDRE